MSQQNLNTKTDSPKVGTSVADPKEDLTKEYIDNRTIVITPVHNYSNYRKVNVKALPPKKEVIGSSISSCRILSSNSKEMEAYMPAIIGLSATHSDFTSRVKAWLSNIQFIVPETGVTLNISFRYNTKKDYIDFANKEEAIDREFAKVDRANITAIKDAVKRKVDALNALESEKHKYGSPLNVEEYLMYRHCLLYKDVAKDTALINSDSSFRFYIKDEAKELEKQKRLTEERVKAMNNFIEINKSELKFNAVFVAIVVAKGENLVDARLKSPMVKTNIVMDYANEHPDKFNRLVTDKTLQDKAFIETLIANGELRRAEFNQQIMTADGDFIGSNISEAIAFFNNPNNKALRDGYENKIKLL